MPIDPVDTGYINTGVRSFPWIPKPNSFSLFFMELEWEEVNYLA